ncbi:MAG: saccharopine dehydrogenase C-terminal domain-containing protein [Pseudomonadota bacterium]
MKALLLGAGLVARPLVRYLLDKGVQVTIASRTKSKADHLLDGHPNGRSTTWVVEDLDGLKPLVTNHDVTISLLPATMHVAVANICLDRGKHMVTTSYVSPEMQALDKKARDKGILLLNEIGVDPGIDHMSAMQIIHDVQHRGGKIVCFRSYCGGIPAPVANNNPWGYKFSWSPMAVLRAGTNSARYLKNGRLIEIPPSHLFLDRHSVEIHGIGRLEAYPNRDSLGYKELYGLKDISTMFRGTLRYPGWCESLKSIGDLGLLSTKEQSGLTKISWAQFMASLINVKNTNNLKQKLANSLWTSVDSPIIQKFDWLGLFSDQKFSQDKASAMELLGVTMQEKMMYAKGEPDMIVMQHDFIADFGATQEHITSSLVDFGIPNGDSSMARTVSLPAAIATYMLLQGKIPERGVQIPILPAIYNPILDELASMNIALKETKTEY